MRTSTWVLAGVLIIGIGGCDRGPEPRVAQPAPSTPVWREPPNYRFEATSECGERAFIGRYRIVVADHRVVEARQQVDSAWKQVEGLDHIMTMGEMLAEGRREEKTADKVVLRFDPVDGHPVLIDIDPSRNSIDDESCYEIVDYTVP